MRWLRQTRATAAHALLFVCSAFVCGATPSEVAATNFIANTPPEIFLPPVTNGDSTPLAASFSADFPVRHLAPSFPAHASVEATNAVEPTLATNDTAVVTSSNKNEISSPQNSLHDAEKDFSSTNAVGQGEPTVLTAAVVKASTDTNSVPDLSIGLDLTNAVQKSAASPEVLARYQKILEEARHLRYQRASAEAQPKLVDLLAEEVPEQIKQAALLELAMVAQDENNGMRAEQIYAQFLNKWPNDLRVPEILLRQGQIFRQLGLNTLALTKFYSVMTSALVLKNDRLGYYQNIVLQAQIEIAETHYLQGKYAEAADFYGRLLKQNSSALNRSQVQYRLVRSFAAVGRNDEVVSQSQDFLSRYPEMSEQPEVRFYLAQALKQLGRNSESLQQVLKLLQEQKNRTKEFPGLWSYWQQRAGNEIANQFYRESDYARALEIYLNLAELDSTPAWRLPVSYQIGMTYERLQQPEKAREAYQEILAKQSEVGTNATPGLKAVFEMAQWRVKFLQWHDKAESLNRALLVPGVTNSLSSSVAKVGGS